MVSPKADIMDEGIHARHGKGGGVDLLTINQEWCD